MSSQQVRILLVTACLCIASLGCKRPSVTPRDGHSASASRHDGKQWLAWQSHDRYDFVSAYIDGYETGVHEACAATDRLLDLKAERRYEHDKDEIVLPSGVCRKGVAHYSKFPLVPTGDSDLIAYTRVLTRFYTAHPEYQNIPFEYLMEYLTDEQNKTTDDLYNMAKAGEMRTNW